MLGFGEAQELLVIFVTVGLFAFIIAMLAHAINNKRLSSTAKVVWVLAIILIYPFGAAYYFYWADVYKAHRHVQSKLKNK